MKCLPSGVRPGVRPTLRNGLSSQIPSMRHAQSFFSIVSLSTFMPSIASAYIFLSSAFSFSSAFRRLASVSSIWPYFFRQRWSVAMEICFCRQNPSWFKSLRSQSRSNRINSSGLGLFCFISRICLIQILSLILGQFSRRRSNRLVGGQSDPTVREILRTTDRG